MNWNIKSFEELSTRELHEILKARAEVFVREQRICCADPDDTDYDSLHLFLTEEGRITAYLRAYRIDENTVKIGRVLALPHGQGRGTALMRTAVSVLPQKLPCTRMTLDAQKQAVPFYRRCGFTVTSAEYLEEGIVHVDMCLEVNEDGGESRAGHPVLS